MNTFLFTWNPKKWAWKTLDADVARCKAKKYFDDRWSCGVTKRIMPGDRAFLMKLGNEQPIGIMASGSVLTEPVEGDHYSDPTKTAWYVDLRYDVLLHPENEELLSKSYLQEIISNVRWTPQASGMSIPPDEAAMLEGLWTSHLSKLGLSPVALSEEVTTPERYWEGALRRISVDAYERDPRARQACLKHHGYACSVCGFEFGSKYGEIGKRFIHVHHLRPLAEIGEEYEVDPVNDLIPICPNCHAMIHKKVPAFSIEELRAKIQR